MPDYGLGRLPAFDPRSRAFGVIDIETRPPRSYTWALPGESLNQRDQPECVGFSFAHELAARPVVLLAQTHLARTLYREAQTIDRAEGRHWEAGASILAGVKAIKARGKIVEYRWAFGVGQLSTAVSRIGPAVIGIPWKTGMFDPDADGYIRPTGVSEGGHAILARAYNIKKRRFLLHNSWGLGWGGRGDAPKGCAWIDEDHLGQLLAEEGDACVPLKRAP